MTKGEGEGEVSKIPTNSSTSFMTFSENIIPVLIFLNGNVITLERHFVQLNIKINSESFVRNFLPQNVIYYDMFHLVKPHYIKNNKYT